MYKLFVATKAFIEHKGKILIIQESDKYSDGTNAGKFDVVGGRIKPGQSFDKSLIREIKEETKLNVTLGAPFYIGEWRPVVRGEKWQVVGTFFHCKTSSANVVLGRDHSDYKWINPKEYKKYKLIENLPPAFEAFLKK